MIFITGDCHGNLGHRRILQEMRLFRLQRFSIIWWRNRRNSTRNRLFMEFKDDYIYISYHGPLREATNHWGFEDYEDYDVCVCGNREYQPEQGPMYYRLKAYAKYLQMCVKVACGETDLEQNCFIIETI